MAHFAKISNENKVLAVLTLDDKNTENSEGVEVESIGQAYLEKHNNWPANMWIKTSYNTSKNTHKKGGTPFRGNYAGIGYKWDAIDQIFRPPQPTHLGLKICLKLDGNLQLEMHHKFQMKKNFYLLIFGMKKLNLGILLQKIHKTI